MKKMLNFALVYAVIAMICGVYFREITKFTGFTDVTTLGKVHTHLFLLGLVVFLLVALFINESLKGQKLFKWFMITYNIGVPLTAIMMLIRGTTQVLKTELSTGANAAISGISGIGHIFTGIGIIFLILSLKKIAKD